VQGASALQKALDELGEPMTVWAIWEPVLAADRKPPAPAVVARLPGSARIRVEHLWDPEHLVSTALQAVEGEPSPLQARLRTDGRNDGILYEAVALFGRDARWHERPPAPLYLDGGVARVARRLKGKVDRIARSHSQ
jgi:hypothetical protein